jgi:UDP-glucose 4-epimerase
MNFDEAARVVVTGGAGFLGSSLVSVLLDRGCHITVVDDLSNGSLRNLPAAAGKLNFVEMVIGDASAADAFDREVAASDFVFHLASPIGVLRAHTDRFAVVQSILAAGSMVIDSCRRHRRPVLFTSSSEVYGPGRDRAISESDPIITDIRPR